MNLTSNVRKDTFILVIIKSHATKRYWGVEVRLQYS
jgi:hypothetical protein